MAQFNRRLKPKPDKFTSALVFGAPCSGVSTILRTLQDVSETSIRVVAWDGFSDLTHVEAEAPNTRLLLDVDGGTVDNTSLIEVVEANIVYPMHGCVVQVLASNEECLARAPDADSVTLSDLQEWCTREQALILAIRQQALAYRTVQNHDLATAVKQLAIILGLRN